MLTLILSIIFPFANLKHVQWQSDSVAGPKRSCNYLPDEVSQMRSNQLLVTGVVVLALLVPLRPVLAAKILIVFPFETIAQCILLKPYIEALVARGHQLTLIHAFPKCTEFDNVNTIYTPDRYNIASGES